MNRYSVGSIIGILLLWEFLVRWLEIPKFLLPAPSTILSYMTTKSRLLVSHTAMTLLEAGAGFIMGSLSAILTAILFLRFRPLKEMSYPYAVILSSTPRVFASIIACSLLGLSFAGVIALIEKRAIAWHISAERR